MFTTVLSLALCSLAIRGVRSESTFAVDTPEIAQCQDASIAWQGGAAPYNLIVVSSSDPCDGPVFADLGDIHNQSLTWKADIVAGTQVMLSLEDANGEEAWSGTITIKGSNDKSCLASNSTSAPVNSNALAPSGSTPATTLVVEPTFKVNPTPATAPSSSQGAVPVGAANAGADPFGASNGASVVGKFNAFAVAATVVGAIFAVGM